MTDWDDYDDADPDGEYHDDVVHPMWVEGCDDCVARAEQIEAERNAREEVKARLGAYLEQIDEQTRLPGETHLREAVAEQARERLRELRHDT